MKILLPSLLLLAGCAYPIQPDQAMLELVVTTYDDMADTGYFVEPITDSVYSCMRRYEVKYVGEIPGCGGNWA